MREVDGRRRARSMPARPCSRCAGCSRSCSTRRRAARRPPHAATRSTSWRATPGATAQRLDLYADIGALGRCDRRLRRRRRKPRLPRVLRGARAQIYRALEQPFLRGSRPNPLSLAVRAGCAALPRAARASRRSRRCGTRSATHFADPRLRQLFGRYATYCGSSPFLAPATLMLVAHVEQAGVWLVEGGMHRLAQALARAGRARAARRFATARTSSEILVRDGRAAGVRLAGGETIAADAVVFNGDVAALAPGLLGATRARRSADAHAAPGAALAVGPDLGLLARDERLSAAAPHRLLLGRLPRASSTTSSRTARLPRDPTVYVCAQDRDRRRRAAPPEAARAPAAASSTRRRAAMRRPIDPEEIGTMRSTDLPPPGRAAACRSSARRATALRTTPADFARLFPATGGALYGRASHGWAGVVPAAGGAQRDAGPVPGGRQHASGPGRADGGAVGRGRRRRACSRTCRQR